MMISGILIGMVLLLFGRSLFWVFVAAAGFVAGVAFTRDVLTLQPDWIVLAVGILAGILAAVLAVFLQQVAVGIAGFLIGGFLLQSLVVSAGYTALSWIAYAVGGVAAALLVVALLDPALVVLSSLAGATLLAQSLDAGPTASVLVFAVALVIGLAVQFSQLRATAPP